MAANTPVIAAAYRTPQGKKDGVYADIRGEDLAVPLIDEILAETGLSGDDVDDLMWGCAQQRGHQDNNVGRVIALMSELGESVPATTINRWCASSMQSVISASDAVAAGNRDCVIAGGFEHMTNVPMEGGMDGRSFHPDFQDMYNMIELQMGMTAEKVAREYDVSREEQDRYAVQSQQRAATATEEGRFDDEIIPIETPDGKVTEDEGIRPGTDFETLQSLPTVFMEDVTAGNSSQISDGAAATLVTSKEFAEEHDLEILAEVGMNNVAGVDPTVMGIGPVPATRGLLERNGRDIEDYDLVELNEAFASQCVYARDELGIDNDIFNVNGGAIAIGHPLGASGARLPVTLIHELRKRGGGRGLATLCVGFGQGAAIEFEVEGE
ncbi:thiolase family protein [Haloarchaeobius sp. HME9146]|uniref:thiolase family protein n=1 Tax=Haloarchaeobius sp. HME9146 TaxID=2978732 RepID=UPI0021C18B78|nr:thiolase family protein [Haloarchaeobius sp. HME9146]MCT9094502.1 thiolase family protein [Haloarchaeobius sp. HME9146]